MKNVIVTVRTRLMALPRKIAAEVDPGCRRGLAGRRYESECTGTNGAVGL